MSGALDRVLDHAATIGVSVSWQPIRESTAWAVRLNDRHSGTPEGYGETIEQAAVALLECIDEQIPSGGGS